MCSSDLRVGRPIDALTQIAQHPSHLVRIGPGREDPVLRTLELRRGHHFHGLGNLLRIFEGRNLAAQTL